MPERTMQESIRDELLRKGQLEPIGTICQRLTGKRPSGPTTWRWRAKGVAGGVKLLAVPVMNSWMTTETAFRDFLNKRAEALLQPHDEEIPSATDADLRAAGLM